MPRFVVQVCAGENHVVPEKRSIVEAPDPKAAAETVLKHALVDDGAPDRLRARVYPEYDLETSATRFFYEP